MHYLYEYGTPGSQLFITFLDGQKSTPAKKKETKHTPAKTMVETANRGDGMKRGVREREREKCQ